MEKPVNLAMSTMTKASLTAEREMRGGGLEEEKENDARETRGDMALSGFSSAGFKASRCSVFQIASF